MSTFLFPCFNCLILCVNINYFSCLCSREKIHNIDNSLVKDSLNILRLERIRCNHLLVYDKVSNVL